MESHKENIYDYIKKIAGGKNCYEDKGFWIFQSELLNETIHHFHKSMGKIRLYYALKCNPHPYIVKALLENGDKEHDGFDCASINEIKEIIKMGGDPKRISYSQTAKNLKEIKEAYKLGVRLTLVDCIEEVEKIAKIKDEVKDLQLLIRYQSNDPTAEYSLSGRFGLEEDEIDEVLEVIHKHGLNFAGVHFHIGVCSHDPKAYNNGLRIARETFDKAEALGYKPNIIDIGGGYSHGESINYFGRVINDALKEYNLEDKIIISEPGRYIASVAFSYVANVILKKKKQRDNLIYYTLDEGLHGCLACCKILGKLVECEPLYPRNGEKIRSIMGGQTNDSHDTVCDFKLEELEIGDWVVFYCIGAYSMSVATNFNGFESRFRPIYILSPSTNNEINLPEEIEKFGIVSLTGKPNEWDL